MKHLCLGLLVLALVFNLTPVFAADATSVVVPIGDWVQATLPLLGWLMAAVATWVLSHVPAIFKTAQVEQLLAKAIEYALNVVAGASKDKVLSADVGNAVIAQALNYATTYGPSWVLKYLGGEQGLRDRIIARLDLHPDVSLIPHGSTLMQPTPSAA